MDPDKQQDREYLEKLFSLDLEQIRTRAFEPPSYSEFFQKRDSICIDSIIAEANSNLSDFYVRQRQ